MKPRSSCSSAIPGKPGCPSSKALQTVIPSLAQDQSSPALTGTFQLGLARGCPGTGCPGGHTGDPPATSPRPQG